MALVASVPHLPGMQIALSIAGSDSGGGAGLQADLKTFYRFGVFGTTVVTAITAQNTLGVAAWQPVSPSLVSAQIDAVAIDLRPAALKSGMLANDAVARAVAEGIRAHGLAPYVLDPVMVASSGDGLIEQSAIATIRSELLPLARLVTPNLDEAEALTGKAVRDVGAMERAARSLVDAGAGAALVKGGHLPGPATLDVLVDAGEVHVFRHRRLDARHTHGTGCTLSAAIVAHLALGHALVDAVSRSLDFVHSAIATAPRLGAGTGPLNHFAEQ